MKKQISILCIIGLLMALLAGCGSLAADAGSNNLPDKEKQKTEAKDSASDYSTIRKQLEATSPNTEIYYPELKGYRGELSMDYMNQSIKQAAEFYAKSDAYTEVHLDYEVKTLNEKLVSILFYGTAKFGGSREINIQKSINLDVKSTNPIVYDSFIKNDEKSRAEIAKLLDAKAKSTGLAEGFQAEGVFLYFEGDTVVFFYMPLDDAATEWVELSLPIEKIEQFTNNEYGEHPAS